MATQQDIDKWDHHGIEIRCIDANVELLIGSDAPEILEPKEIRASRNGGPYASRTILGWVVNGPLGRASSCETQTANFIKADLELTEQFHNFCNVDFND